MAHQLTYRCFIPGTPIYGSAAVDYQALLQSMRHYMDLLPGGPIKHFVCAHCAGDGSSWDVQAMTGDPGDWVELVMRMSVAPDGPPSRIEVSLPAQGEGAAGNRDTWILALSPDE